MKVHTTGMTASRRRSLALGAVSVTAALVLTACGGGDSAESADSTDLSTAGATTLTMWVDAERSPALTDVTAQFKEDTGIEIKLVTKDFEKVSDDFITQVPSGKGPDLIVGPHDWLGKFVLNGVISPIELGDKAADFQESAVAAMTYEGSTYGVPYSIENIGLLRNADLVPEPAATMEEVIANGKDAVATKGAEFPFLVGMDPKQGDPYHLYPFQTSMGVPVFGTDETGGYDASKLELGNENGAAFAAKVKEWGEAGAGILNSNITADIAKEKFNAGASPYFLTGPWNVPLAEEAGINVVVDPLPTAGDQPAQPFVGVNGFFISSKSANSLAATEFALNYLTTEAVQDAMFEGGGRPPALNASFDKAAADPTVAAFGEIGANGVPMPAIPEMGAVWADWGGTELALIKGQGDPAESWATMVSNVEAKIAK